VFCVQVHDVQRPQLPQLPQFDELPQLLRPQLLLSQSVRPQFDVFEHGLEQLLEQLFQQLKKPPQLFQ